MNEYTPNDPTQEIPDGYCHCGCGGKTRIAKHTDRRYDEIKGQPNQYIQGHNHPRVPVEERFWEKVAIGEPDECWEWQAARNTGGYGVFTRAPRQNQNAHRAAYEFTYGPIPSELLACHKCNNPSCCNPSHIYPGTQYENMQDMVIANRQRNGCLSHTPRRPHQLTREQVLVIRQRHASGNATIAVLANEYQASWDTIHDVVKRHSWKNIP